MLCSVRGLCTVTCQIPVQQATAPSGGREGARGLHGTWNYLEACSDADIISRVSLFSNVPSAASPPFLMYPFHCEETHLWEAVFR